MKFVHFKSLFLVFLALTLTYKANAKLSCKKLFLAPSALKLMSELKQNPRVEPLQLYSLHYLRSKGITLKAPKDFYSEAQHNVLFIHHTDSIQLNFAVSLIKSPSVWVAPPEIFSGQFLTPQQKLFAGRKMYKKRVVPILEQMGARTLKPFGSRESEFLSQKLMRIEIKSAIYHAYHHYYKSPPQSDYIKYREERAFLTRTEHVTLESFELLKQFPFVFYKTLAHPHFNVNLLEYVLTLPRPYLKLIEEGLLYDNQNYIFMNSTKQPITRATLFYFSQVLNLLNNKPVVLYEGHLSPLTKEMVVEKLKSF